MAKQKFYSLDHMEEISALNDLSTPEVKHGQKLLLVKQVENF